MLHSTRVLSTSYLNLLVLDGEEHDDGQAANYDALKTAFVLNLKPCTTSTTEKLNLLPKKRYSPGGSNLWERFCKTFSQNSTGRWALLQLPCCPSSSKQVRGTFTKTFYKNLGDKLPPGLSTFEILQGISIILRRRVKRNSRLFIS